MSIICDIYSILNIYNIITYECPNHNKNEEIHQFLSKNVLTILKKIDIIMNFIVPIAKKY